MTRFSWWAIARSKEISTWNGVTLILMAVGINISPGSWQAIVSIGAVLMGLLDIIKKGPKEQKLENYDERLNNGG